MRAEDVQTTAPPLPGPWLVSQRWRWVSFLHWRVPSADVAPLLPPGTRPDEFDGSSWVGMVAFHLSQFRIRPGIPLAYFGTFPQTNLRLYSVDESGRRGVVFRSLEAPRLLTGWGVRATLRMPYEWASMTLRTGPTVEYASRRRGTRHPESHLEVRPLPGEVRDDPLADFLTARWGLHVRSWGRTRYIANEHEPWPLQPAELITLDNDLVAAAGLPGVASRPPDSVLYSPGVTTRFTLPRALP